MKALKKVFRLLFLLLFLLLASFGMGLNGVLNGNRERYMDNEIRTEQPVKKDDEEDETAEIKG